MEATANLEYRVRAWEAEFLSELATPSYPAERPSDEPTEQNGFDSFHIRALPRWS